MKFAVVQFPGSNCDHDAYSSVNNHLKENAEYVWHKDKELPADTDCVILPGGFSYGDYLRSGAIAGLSPIMDAVKKFADNGGYVIGICNGFQILTEAGLLPGALLRNKGLQFLCKDVFLKVENKETSFTHKIENDVVRFPIAHNEGNYFADEETIKSLEANKQVVFRYCTEDGEVTDEINPNGAINNIAGIINEKGNVLGMMPHPERYCDPVLGCDDGLGVFESLLDSFLKK
jgi:phosphoribosylformylglycinamidine synthase